MAESNQHNQDDLEYLSKRFSALDRDIRVPESVKAQALMQRAQSAPKLRVVQGGMWKRVAGLAAALVVVVSGAVYLLPQMEQMTADQPQSSAAAQMLAAAPEAAAAYDVGNEAAPRMAVPAPRAQEMDTFYAKDYAEVRARLKEVQIAPVARDTMEKESFANPDVGGGGITTGGGGDSDATQSEVYTTNVQTKGVDEADIVKTDGEYLYYLCTPQTQGEKAAQSMVKILKSDTLAVASTISFAEDNYPTEMFLSGDKLAVLTRSSIGEVPIYETYTTGVKENGSEIIQSTVIDIYDVSNPAKPVSERRFEQQGYYTSSRMAEDIVYLITNSPAPANAHISEVTNEQLIPSVLNTAISATPSTLAPEDICLPLAVTNAAYTVVSAVSLSEPANTTTKAVLGGGDIVYMSRDNLYIAGVVYDKALGGSSTKLIKLSVAGTGIALLAQDSVPGRVYGQFAMSESAAGNLCVATTTQQFVDPVAANTTQQAKEARAKANRAGSPVKVDEATREKEREAIRKTTHSSVYVLGHYLDRMGQVEGLAPEESIYSVRYIGDMAYLVTFKQVDPLFAVDLSDPAAPKVLGQLKVPGFSEYLHPIGSNALLGLGYETQALDDGTATTLGLKLSLFDVSNPSKPAETQTYRMGDSGSSSRAINTHKAFMYYGEKNLVGIPVTLNEEIGDKTGDPWARNYKFAFDGLYLFKVTPEKIEYYGAVTHSAGLDGDTLYQKGMEAERGMFVGDALYLFSNSMVTAYSLTTLDQTAQVHF